MSVKQYTLFHMAVIMWADKEKAIIDNIQEKVDTNSYKCYAIISTAKTEPAKHSS